MQAIYANASTPAVRQPRNLRTVVEAIDALDWYSAKSEGLGDLYEGLLEKNAEETKSGAGQYFRTPRPLIECMVALIKPQPGERVQDPQVGTGGFLINADRYVKAHTDDLHDLPVAKQNFQRREAFYGVELVADVQRLALMNAMLHDIEGDIVLGDTLGPTGAKLPKADVILTNPPFGTKKGGGGPTRDDITYPTSNKQLVFLQHIYRGLKAGGRGAVVMPDNVLFEEGVGQRVRADLMDKLRPTHDPAATDRHLLRTGRQDERAVLHAKGRRTKATRRRCGSSTCGRTCRRSGSGRRLRGGILRSSRRRMGRIRLGEASGRTSGRRGGFGGLRGRRLGSGGTILISRG